MLQFIPNDCIKANKQCQAICLQKFGESLSLLLLEICLNVLKTEFWYCLIENICVQDYIMSRFTHLDFKIVF